jgi:hypothetical protein
VTALVAVGLVGLAAVLRAPSEPPPANLAVPLAATEPVAFDPSPWDRVCACYVDDRGRVDYPGLLRTPRDLQDFLQQVTTVPG